MKYEPQPGFKLCTSTINSPKQDFTLNLKKMVWNVLGYMYISFGFILSKVYGNTVVH